ncbi:MAG TPA: DNA repair protein RadC [Candidatus Rifleibacterium sp.]|nr:DNA repair protein RadC [Candidatus Rifleibacterium sp.]HPT44914.1 DNA repair protein RadC [Candidatus Rifleibacterium sp.]
MQEKNQDTNEQEVQPIEANPNDGHRDRVRDRFDSTGLEGFADHEVLEMLLHFIFKRKDTKALAKDLITEFGSLEKVFAANAEQLKQIKGMGPAAARLVAMVREISLLLGRRRAIAVDATISNGSDLIRYLGEAMQNLPEEQLRVIFVNNANRIIKDEVLSKGVEDQTAVFPRQVMKRAMNLHATGIIVVHNHPTGQLRPSNADLVITRSLVAAAETLGIRMLDHLIVGSEDKGYFSFRENGLL